MMGRKLSTLPTPVKMPSIMSEWMAGLTFAAVSAASTAAESASMPAASSDCSPAPMTLNVR